MGVDVLHQLGLHLLLGQPAAGPQRSEDIHTVNRPVLEVSQDSQLRETLTWVWCRWRRGPWISGGPGSAPASGSFHTDPERQHQPDQSEIALLPLGTLSDCSKVNKAMNLHSEILESTHTHTHLSRLDHH